MAIERIQIPVGAKFDTSNPQHLDVLMKKVAEAGHGVGWELQSFDPATSKLTLSRRSLLTQVTKDDGPRSDSYRVELSRGTKVSDGDKIAANLESDPQHAGYYVTKFDPYISQATMSKLTEQEVRARAATAVALGVKPWDVQVKATRGGGFDIGLPGSYVPSKFDTKLEEVASQIVGKPGWYWEANPATMTGRIVPGELPVFEPVYQFDFSSLPAAGKVDAEIRFRFPLGVALGGRGRPNTPIAMDLSDSVGALVVGLAGSGKSTAVQSIVFSALARNYTLALINSVDKATDFAWAKHLVADGMWGCDSLAQAVAVAKRVGEVGERRGVLLSEHGVSKWQDLPASVRAENPPMLLVADELAALLTADPLPAGLPREVKALPEFVQMQQDLLESKLLATSLAKIPALYRAAGIRVIYLTQQPNERYGFSTKLKGNLPHRVILGTNPSPAEKAHAFRTPEKVPDVPGNVANDSGQARGVGLAHLDGAEPAVFKGYFAPLDAYISEARRRGFPTTLNPAPSESEIARLVPRVDGDGYDDEPPAYGAGPRQYEDWEIDPDTGKPLSGFARANAARAALSKPAGS